MLSLEYSTLRLRLEPLVNRAIVAVGASGRVSVLDYVGRQIQYWMSDFVSDNPDCEDYCGDGCDKPGLWYIEGYIYGSRSYDGEYDAVWRNSLVRRLEPEEIAVYHEGITPFEDERIADWIWTKMERLLDQDCRLHIDGLRLTVLPFADGDIPENYEGIREVVVQVPSLLDSRKELQQLFDDLNHWRRMREDARAVKKLIVKKIREEDPDWQSGSMDEEENAQLTQWQSSVF